MPTRREARRARSRRSTARTDFLLLSIAMFIIGFGLLGILLSIN